MRGWEREYIETSTLRGPEIQHWLKINCGVFYYNIMLIEFYNVKLEKM